MKVKTKKLLAMLVTLAMCMGLMSMPVMAEGDAWSNNADITWYTGHETDTEFTLSTGAQLAGLAQLVNGGNSFEGKTIKLGADIDLDNKEWTPIGNTTNGFNGNFYGQNKTIKNLVINQSNMNAVGLFGTIQSLNLTYLKDLTVENVNITGSQSVGAVVGMTRSVRCENIKVTGNINITGQCYVGGVVGTSLSSNVYNITVEGTGSVNSITGTYVKNDFEGDSIGGVVGFYSADNNGYLMDKINVSNVTVTGTRKIGGVVGSTHIHNALTNIKVSNVTVGTNAPKDYNKASTMGIGGIVGLYEPGNNQVDGKLENASVSDITLENTTNKENASFGYITGGARGIVEPTLTGGVRNITVNGANAGANNTYLYDAIAISDVEAYINTANGEGNIRFITTVNSGDATDFGTYFVRDTTITDATTLTEVSTEDAHHIKLSGENLGSKKTFMADMINVPGEYNETPFYAISYVRAGCQVYWSASKGVTIAGVAGNNN